MGKVTKKALREGIHQILTEMTRDSFIPGLDYGERSIEITEKFLSDIEQPQDLHTCQPQDIADEEISRFPNNNRENWERLQAIGHVKGLKRRRTQG